MKRNEQALDGRKIVIFSQDNARQLLIQPVDEHDSALLESEASYIEGRAKQRFALAAFEVKDWNRELSPWSAPPVFGKEPFGAGARETLQFITDSLLPRLFEEFGEEVFCAIGGYSLAGLFALWTGFQTNLFSGAAAVSPSVWFPGWIDYCERQKPLADHIYLSLGDKEEKTRNPALAAIGDNIRRQYALLKSAGINCALEWNEGNHFRDSDIRTAKGFVWLMDQAARE